LPGKGNPQLKLRLDLRIFQALEIEARSRGLTPQQVVYALVEGYIAGVGGVVPPSSPLSGAELNRVIITKLKLLLGQLHFEVASLDLRKDLDKAAQALNQVRDSVVFLVIREKAGKPLHLQKLSRSLTGPLKEPRQPRAQFPTMRPIPHILV